MKKTPFVLIFVLAFALLTSCACAYGVRLPDELTVIGEQAFRDNAALEKVVLPESLARIESQAFANSGLNSIYCSDLSKIEIADDAFDEKAYFLFPLQEDHFSAVCGERGQIDFSIYPPLVSLPEFNFTSSDPSSLSVDADGLITAYLSGSTEISISSAEGMQTTLDIRVKKWADVYDPIAVAHRGASGYKPDNTIAAFKYADKLNADMVELDVRKTKDGKIVCFHDAEISSGSRDYAISGLTLKELRSIKGDICTLEEAIDYIAGTDMLLQIEFKSGGIEKQTVNLIQQAGIQDRTYYGSFTLSILKKIKTIDPCAKLVYITNLNSTVSSVIKNPDNFNVDVMSIRCDLLTEKKIARLHLAGMQVYGWTIDAPSSIKKYSDLGLDGVISNYPDRV